jgi:hypothetical protein
MQNGEPPGLRQKGREVVVFLTLVNDDELDIAMRSRGEGVQENR